jgi:hypothetical protein
VGPRGMAYELEDLQFQVEFYNNNICVNCTRLTKLDSITCLPIHTNIHSKQSSFTLNNEYYALLCLNLYTEKSQDSVGMGSVRRYTNVLSNRRREASIHRQKSMPRTSYVRDSRQYKPSKAQSPRSAVCLSV